MPATAAWDETVPVGSDLASSIDNFMREMKRDIRERIGIDHIWNDGVSTDGYHKSLSLKPSADATPISTTTPNSLTGSTAGGLINLSQTWNTTGLCSAIKVDITDTASHASSVLFDLKVGGVSKFTIDKTGTVTVGSVSGVGTGNVSASSNFGTDNVLVRSDGVSKNVQHTGIAVNDSNDMSGIAQLTYGKSAVFSWNSKTIDTVYQALSDGLVICYVDAVSGPWDGYIKVYTDASNPPTTLRGSVKANDVYVGANSVTVPVKKGDYWKAAKVDGVGGTFFGALYWVPLGLNG